MRDIVSKWGTTRNNLVSATLTKHNANTARSGADVNTAGYNGCLFYIIPGAYTDGTFTFLVEEADDNGSGSAGSYGTVANADLVAWKATSTTDFTPVKIGNAQPAVWSSAGTFLYQRVGYIGGKQWVRVTCTQTSNGGTGASYEVISELGEPRNMPASV